ncbi:hypothetical protein BESB_002130 [Besnoitia besnoiti]|uniref:Uncharacterized protein n=1 Tax=Besnoitia besnoiti TaxID=94643 RepID=A0A2A9MPT7_BESBE|nr:hypothetical protein BESB_002130 [Besnoitia besnoiti]PFH37872.1 hypothetical protein BESB_002130 [Besnoitia besnoiti]
MVHIAAVCHGGAGSSFDVDRGRAPNCEGSPMNSSEAAADACPAPTGCQVRGCESGERQSCGTHSAEASQGRERGEGPVATGDEGVSSDTQEEDPALWTWLNERLCLCYVSILQQHPPGKAVTAFANANKTASAGEEGTGEPHCERGGSPLPSVLSASSRSPLSFFVSSSSPPPFDRPFPARSAETEHTATGRHWAGRGAVAAAAVPPEVTLRWLSSLPPCRRQNILQVLRKMKEEEEAALWGETDDEEELDDATASSYEGQRPAADEAGGDSGPPPGDEASSDAGGARGSSESGKISSQHKRRRLEEAGGHDQGGMSDTGRDAETADVLSGQKEETMSRRALVGDEAPGVRSVARFNTLSGPHTNISLSSRSFFLFPPESSALSSCVLAAHSSLSPWSSESVFLPAGCGGTWPGAAGVWEQAGVKPAFQLGELVMHSWQGRFQLAIVLERRIFFAQAPQGSLGGRRGADAASQQQEHACFEAMADVLVSPVALKEEKERQRRGKRRRKEDGRRRGEDGDDDLRRKGQEAWGTVDDSDAESDSSDDDTFFRAAPEGGSHTDSDESASSASPSSGRGAACRLRKKFEVIYRVVCLGYNKIATRKSFGEWTRESRLMVVDGVDVLRKCRAHNERAIRDVKEAGLNAWQVQAEAVPSQRFGGLSSVSVSKAQPKEAVESEGAQAERNAREGSAGGARGRGRGRRGARFARGGRGSRGGSREGGSPREEEAASGDPGAEAPRGGTARGRGRGRAARSPAAPRRPSENAGDDESEAGDRDESTEWEREAAESMHKHAAARNCDDKGRERQAKAERLRRKLFDDMEQLKKAEESRRQEEVSPDREDGCARQSGKRAEGGKAVERKPVEIHPLWKLPRWLAARLNQNRSLILLRSFPMMPHELRAARVDSSAGASTGRRGSLPASESPPPLGELTVAELQERFERALFAFIREKKRREEEKTAEPRRPAGVAGSSMSTSIPCVIKADGVSPGVGATANSPSSFHTSLSASSAASPCPSASQARNDKRTDCAVHRGETKLSCDSATEVEGTTHNQTQGVENASFEGEQGVEHKSVQGPQAASASQQLSTQSTRGGESVLSTSGSPSVAVNEKTERGAPGPADVEGSTGDAAVSGIAEAVTEKEGAEGREETSCSGVRGSGPVSSPASSLPAGDSGSDAKASQDSSASRVEQEVAQSPVIGASVSPSSSSASSLAPLPTSAPPPGAASGRWAASGSYTSSSPAASTTTPSDSASSSLPPPSPPASSGSAPPACVLCPSASDLSSAGSPLSLSLAASPLPLASPSSPASCRGVGSPCPSEISRGSWDAGVEAECAFFSSQFAHLSAADAQALWGPLTGVVAFQVDWLDKHFLALACHTEEEAADLRDHQRRQQSRRLSEIVGLEHWARCLHPATMARHHLGPVLERLPLPLQKQFVRLMQLTVHYLTHLWKRKIEESSRKGVK